MADQTPSPDAQTQFSRLRAVLWICDIAGSSSRLNDPKTVDATEEFLKRFFWISALLVKHSGGVVGKWTGDGFLAAYRVPLERDLGLWAGRAITAAWHMSVLVNTTQLGVSCPQRFRLRHGVAFEPDAILVSHNLSPSTSTDIIGRGVVLAFRFSGVTANDLPGVVTHKRIVDAAREVRVPGVEFRRLRLGREEVLKYFKGERRGTSDVYVSVDLSKLKRRVPSRRSGVTQAKRVLETAVQQYVPSKRGEWVVGFIRSLEAGPPWARDVVRRYEHNVRDLFDLLRTVVAKLETRGQDRGGQTQGN
jgi:class 3 adenylate cyclase